MKHKRPELRAARNGALALAVVVAGCAHVRSAAAVDGDAASQTVPAAAVIEAKPAAPPSETAPEGQTFVAWLKERVPPGGEVVTHEGDAPSVVHTARDGDTLTTVASAYLDLTDVYHPTDLATELTKANPATKAGIAPGDKLRIPRLLTAPYKNGDADRIGWPADKKLRGIYMRGPTAASRDYVPMLDRLAARGMNLVVIDTKDTDGWITYKSKVPLAVEIDASHYATIRDLARTIRFAHARGVRVAMRVSCFHDEWTQHHKPALSVKGKWGGPYPLGWLDPTNEDAYRYIIDLVSEAMDAGADEIQLDYVRFPVIGTGNADFHLKERKLTRVGVIRDFVRRVHDVTSKRNVPLSLDVFGVIALGQRIDIDALGQDLELLGPECEALSPMIYPSHYSKGFAGFENPGEHPEVIGIGTRGTVNQVNRAHAKAPLAVVRPWLQAFYQDSPNFGADYVKAEVRNAEANGGSGWLMWNPGQDYTRVWEAIPKKKP